MKTKIVLGVIGFFILMGLLTVGGWIYRYYTAPIKGKVTAQEEVHKGTNRIQKYNHFYDLCARAQEVNKKVKIQQEQLKSSTDEDQKNRIRTNVAALKGEFQRAVRKYNADARKEYTMGQFRASDLPYELPTNLQERGLRCTVN